METVSFINGLENTLYLYEVLTSEVQNEVVGYQLLSDKVPLTFDMAIASAILMVTFYLGENPVTYFNSHNFGFMPGTYTITINQDGLMQFAGTGSLIYFEPISGNITSPSMDEFNC